MLKKIGKRLSQPTSFAGLALLANGVAALLGRGEVVAKDVGGTLVQTGELVATGVHPAIAIATVVLGGLAVVNRENDRD